MLNVMQITSTLRGMSDQQLAQYAAMHKADPYIFPLAFQESQDRKSMRAGKMAQMAGQKPPPVVDQDLQQMTPQMPTGIPMSAPNAPTGVPMQGPGSPAQSLPEDQGIGALPAKNLQGMKDGGITGEHHFRDGGTEYKPITDEQLKAVQYSAPNATEMQAGIMGMAEPLTKESADVYKPFEEYFKQQQADLSERKDRNIGNALLTAGLGMMGGTSPYALQNISKGGLEGLGAYNAAQKADEEAKRALMQSQLALAQAKQADKIGNRNYAAGLYEKAETLKSHAAQSQAKALEIKSTDQYHMGALQNAEMVAKNNAAYQQGMLGYHKTMADIARESKPTGSDLLNIRLNRLLETDPGYKSLLDERKQAAKDRDDVAYDLVEKKIQSYLTARRQELGMPPGVMPESVQPKPTDVQESHWYDFMNPDYKNRLKPSTTMGDILAREDDGISTGLPKKLPAGVQFLGYEK